MHSYLLASLLGLWDSDELSYHLESWDAHLHHRGLDRMTANAKHYVRQIISAAKWPAAKEVGIQQPPMQEFPVWTDLYLSSPATWQESLAQR